jgi:hypothetical protein
VLDFRSADDVVAVVVLVISVVSIPQ